jgi:hypothetical protein
MITRRQMILGASGAAASGVLGPGRSFAQEAPPVLERAPLDISITGTPAPVEELDLYTGDVLNLWVAPWEIGTKAIEVGGTIVHRFVGTPQEGFVLGPEGEQLVFQSVIYLKQDWSFFVGVNSDLSEIEGARTLIVTGTYGGLQTDTASSGIDRPILIAHQIEIP